MTVRELISELLEATDNLDETVEVRDNEGVYFETDRVSRVPEDGSNPATVFVETGDEV